MKRFRSRSFSRSFALISVLALVSLAALTATAFLAVARLDRVATRSIGSQTQLDMTLQAGAEMARTIIDTAFQDSFLPAIVTCVRADPTNDLGYLLLGKPTNNNTVAPVVRFYPAFSQAGVSNLSLSGVGTNRFSMTNASVAHQGVFSSVIASSMQAWTNGFGTAAQTDKYVRIPLLSATNTTPNDQDWSPAVGWITLSAKTQPTNNTETPYARVAFFIQDMSGLIDADRMGGLTNRDTGTNPAEISLTNAFGTSLVNATTVQNLTNTNNRRYFLSPGLLRHSADLTTNDLRYVASGLRSSLVWSNLIPFGIAVSPSAGYSQAGSNRYALTSNNLTNAGAMATLVSLIGSNLPGFTNRAGAMAGPTYLSTIAANIQDYADTDSVPTYSAPDIRGSEALAWPNEIIYQVRFTNTDTLLTNGGFQYAFKFKQYLETWNIHQKEVPAVPLTISNNLEILVRIPGIGGGTFTLGSLASPEDQTRTATNVAGAPATLKPGEFGMLETEEQTFVYLASGATNITNVIFQDCGGNQVVISSTNAGSPPLTRTLAGMQIYTATNTNPVLDPAWLTANQFVSAVLQPNVYRTGVTTVGGDPRAQFFLRDWQVKCSPYVDYSSPGGRNYEQGNASFSNSEVNPQLFWPDGGRTIAADKGANPTSQALPNQRPNALYVSKIGTWSTNLALARVNDSGSFSNVCELGNVFDPIQWADSSQLPASAGGQRALWTNLSTAATNDARFCGRTSLRIGQPEFTRFAFTNFGGAGSIASPNMGAAASSLLDLFSVTNAPMDHGGKINLNTAPGPVLAALAGGCRLTKDPALTGVGGSGTNFPIPVAMATNAFVRGIQLFRARYPFYTPSQMNFISTSPGSPSNWPQDAVFGNTNPLTTSAGTARLNVTAANNAAMEEWFGKVFGLAAVTSFNFRVYVVAQLLDARGQPTSGFERRLFQIYCDYNSEGALSTKQVTETPY